ncbi:MAG: universal stress protein [Vicinamibacterales bacterium]
MPHAPVICAVDLERLSTRVIYHAAGLAAALGAPLVLVAAVGDGDSTRDATAALQRAFAEAIPYDASVAGEPEVSAAPGAAVDVVLAEAAARDAALIVAGTRARGELARLLLGSTSADLLQRTDRPLLLVPPTDVDIVTLVGTGVSLHFGAVLVAVDLAESNTNQLDAASQLAALARQPLLAMTVADKSGASDHDVAAALRSATARMSPVAPSAYIVRRGDPAQEIARAALAEQAGLVVMGLRREGRGRPGATATAVLQSHRALVLAVPG